MKVRMSAEGTRRPYAIMADETTDASRTAQLSLCARYVDDELVTHERFLGLHSTDSTNADALVSIIQDSLIRLDLSMESLRGQCYDGAANMSGRATGVQAQMKKV